MYSISNPLITSFELKSKLPLLPPERLFIEKSRKQAENILRRVDDRLVIFAGPCSIHNAEVALSYAKKLKELACKVEDRIFLIMRVFLEKPRTQFGWKGFIYDPYLDGSNEIEEGLFSSRKFLLKIAALNIPVATEFLDPILASYHKDLITWGVIGARTSASQIHRQLASDLGMPIGFKNETDGLLDNAIRGALAARHPQSSIGVDEHGRVCSLKTTGNAYTHIILRGSNERTNYDLLSITQAIQKQRLFGLHSPLVIDCAHGNSQKNLKKQLDVFSSVLNQIINGNHLISGMMLESHLQEGNIYSITDPCIGWKMTKELILEAYSA